MKFGWAAVCVVLVGTSASCTTASFECQTDQQCASAAEGTCEPTGYCSFPDTDCGSGRRYGTHAGGLAEQCVEDDGATGTSTTGFESTTVTPIGSEGSSSSSTTGAVSATMATSSGVTTESSETSTTSAETTSTMTGEPTTGDSAESGSSTTGEPEVECYVEEFDVDPIGDTWYRWEDSKGMVAVESGVLRIVPLVNERGWGGTGTDAFYDLSGGGSVTATISELPPDTGPEALVTLLLENRTFSIGAEMRFGGLSVFRNLGDTYDPIFDVEDAGSITSLRYVLSGTTVQVETLAEGIWTNHGAIVGIDTTAVGIELAAGSASTVPVPGAFVVESAEICADNGFE